MFTARYGLISYIKQIAFILEKVKFRIFETTFEGITGMIYTHIYVLDNENDTFLRNTATCLIKDCRFSHPKTEHSLHSYVKLKFSQS